MRVAIDFHDTITYKPGLFGSIIDSLKEQGHEIYIISGTPEKEIDTIKSSLEQLDIEYDYLLCGFNYDKEHMDGNHFKKMADWKLYLCKQYNIDIYIDDNPYYVKKIANEGILVLQTILSEEYIDQFSKKDPYFTCNLQAKQFDFLNSDFILERKTTNIS